MSDIDYSALIAQVNAEAPIDRDYAKSTQKWMKDTENFWAGFCESKLKQDPYEILQVLKEKPERGIIIAYITWRCDIGEARKQSTVLQYFKCLQAIFLKHHNSSLSQDVSHQVKNYIRGPLSKRLELIVGVKDKQIVSSVDFVRLLQGIWMWRRYRPDRILIQALFISKLLAYTASRPGALLETAAYRDEALEYRDVKLVLIRGLSGEKMFALEVAMDKRKGERGKNEAVTFALLEIPDNPILCPVIDFITLALSDQAFYGVESSKALYQLQIPQGLDRMEIPFKSELLGKPICVHRGRRGRHELLQPLTADSLNYMLQKGGEHAGFKDNVTAYWLRRGAGNALDGKVSSTVRNLIMGHSRSSIYQNHYASRKIQVDTQSNFLGTAPETELLQVLRRVERNPAAPPALGKYPTRQLKNEDPELCGLIQQREAIKREFKARGEPFSGTAAFSRASKAVSNRRAKLLRATKVNSRASHFQDHSKNEVLRQTSGQGPSQYVEPERTYQSAEHRYLVEAVLDSLHPEYSRQEMIRDFVLFSGNPSLEIDVSSLEIDVTNPKAEMCVDNTMNHSQQKPSPCPFCPLSFVNSSNLKRHVKIGHLPASNIPLENPITCPSPLCDIRFENIDHLKNHIASKHDLILSADSKSVVSRHTYSDFLPVFEFFSPARTVS